MDLRRLFHVLVIGGSVAAGCERTRGGALSAADAADTTDVGMPEVAAPEAPVAVEDAAAPEVASMDGSAETAAAMDAATSMDGADGPATEPCLCSATRCCDLHEGAPATVQPGLHCCWGTTC